MSCSNYTNNGIPVGIGYNSNGDPKSLVELNRVAVNQVQALSVSTPHLTVATVSSVAPGPIIFLGQVSATSYLGAGGGGVSNFVELGDVQPGLTLDSSPNKIIYVTPGGKLSAIDASGEIFSSVYQAKNDLLTDIASLNPTANEIIIFVGGGNASTTTVSPFIKDLLDDPNSQTAIETLGLGSLAVSNSLNTSDLGDVSEVAPEDGQVLVFSVGDGVYTPSTVSFGGGGGVTDHGALTGLLDEEDHPQYVLSSTNQVLSSITLALQSASTTYLVIDGSRNANTITVTGALNVSGNINVNGTVDGRDVSSDWATTNAHINNTSIHVYSISENITVPNPSASTEYTIFHTSVSCSLDEISAVIRGSGSVTWRVYRDSSRSAAGTLLASGTTSTESGEILTSDSFESTLVSSNNYVWVELITVDGTIAELHLTLRLNL